MHRELLSLPKNRTLEIVTSGTPSKEALVLHHGAFGSSENMAPIFKLASELGYFAIGITRPGYAGSTRREGRRTNNYFLETQFALNYFDIESFVSIGWSSGSPAAFSDTQDHRCVGVVTIAGDAPRDSADWEIYLNKFQPNNPATELSIFPSCDDLREVNGKDLAPLFNQYLSQCDVEVCNGSFGEDIALACRHGLSSGDFGALDDLESDAAPWGLNLSNIEQPVAIFQGLEDRMCTPAHGHFLADKTRNSTLILKPNEGHISLFYNHVDEIVNHAISYLKN